MKPSGGCFSDEKHSVQSWSLLIMPWEDMADQSSLPNKFRLSFSTGVVKHPPDGFIPVLRDRQFLDGFLSTSAISSHRVITSLRDCAECFSSLFFTFCALTRWEDMADKNPPRNCLPLSTRMKPSGGCFRARVLKDRRNFGRKAF